MRKVLGISFSLIGMLYLLFLLTVYPSLVGSYGAYEQMSLTKENEFTDALYLNGDISFKLTSQKQFILKIDGVEVGTFTSYSGRLKGEHLIEVESKEESIVYAELKQHPDTKNYLLSFGFIILGSAILLREKKGRKVNESL